MDPHDVLGVGAGASEAEIRFAADQQRRALVADGAPQASLDAVDAALDALLGERARTPSAPVAYGVPRPGGDDARAEGAPGWAFGPPAEPGVRLTAPYPDRVSRGLLFVKWLLVIPAYVVLAFYGLAVLLTSAVGLLSVLALGRYPEGLFGFARGYLRMYVATTLYFPLFMTDRYPLNDDLDAIDVAVEPPRRLSRGLALVKVGSLVLGVAANTMSLVLILATIVAVPMWFVLLVRGRYPQSVFRPMRALTEWVARLWAWQWFLRDELPWLEASRKASLALGVVALAPAVLTTLSVLGTFDGPTWRTYVSPDGRYAVELPGEVVEQASTTDFLFGPIDSRLAMATREGGVFVVGVHDLPPALVSGLDEMAFLTEWRTGYEQSGYVFQSDEAATISGHAGRVFALELPLLDAVGWLQTFIADGELFELLVVSPSPRAFLEAERFFASFELR